jgi:hypothetical protein
LLASNVGFFDFLDENFQSSSGSVSNLVI